MSEAILLAIIGIAEMVITSIVTFFLTKRKYRNEVNEGEIHNHGYEIDNDEKKFNLYIKMINENEKRIDRLQKENDDLSTQFAEMRSVVFSMLQQICTDMMCQKRSFDREKCPYYETIFKEIKKDQNNEEAQQMVE